MAESTVSWSISFRVVFVLYRPRFTIRDPKAYITNSVLRNVSPSKFGWDSLPKQKKWKELPNEKEPRNLLDRVFGSQSVTEKTYKRCDILSGCVRRLHNNCEERIVRMKTVGPFESHSSSFEQRAQRGWQCSCFCTLCGMSGIHFTREGSTCFGLNRCSIRRWR